MGLHRDGEALGLRPFETEIRRRLWWRIYMLDARCGLKSGLGPSMMPSLGDCKMPTNLNDSELDLDSKSYFRDRDGPSEMAVFFFIYSMGKFLAERLSVEASVIQHEIDITSAPSSNSNPSSNSKSTRGATRPGQGSRTQTQPYHGPVRGPFRSKCLSTSRPLQSPDTQQSTYHGLHASRTVGLYEFSAFETG
ncbi:hypothetical protein NW765_016903 [Fusarium oxysporum]|nr:hypothetical protein NW765_016903 [Fusarium oxysporum]KAJ4265178.1 hypothetical protein NW764_015739 [Fusarium oxysporum]